jgi:drug/metabolite transporter (DMT)-like permease
VLLGWAFANEPVTTRTLLAAAVILAGVAIITVARDTRPAVEDRKRAAA